MQFQKLQNLINQKYNGTKLEKEKFYKLIIELVTQPNAEVEQIRSELEEAQKINVELNLRIQTLENKILQLQEPNYAHIAYLNDILKQNKIKRWTWSA